MNIANNTTSLQNILDSVNSMQMEVGVQADLITQITEKVKKRAIAFCIADSIYAAEAGMTWQEWCDSNYNTNGYVADGRLDNSHVSTGANMPVIDNEDNYV